MRRLALWSAIVGLAACLTSCGVASAVGRSAGRLVQGAANIAGAAQ